MAKEARLQIRMEEELLASLEECAKKADISTNQVVRGLLRWFLDKAHPGREPYHDNHGLVCDRSQPGCIWAGRKGVLLSDEERQEAAYLDHCDPKDVKDFVGEVALFLDFTERRVLRDEFESKPPETGVPRKGTPKSRRG